MSHAWFSIRNLAVTLAFFTSVPLFASAVKHPALAQTPSPGTANKPAIAADLLTSDRNINYAPLQDLLRTGQWGQANQLTSQLVLQAANRRQQGYLVATEIKALPCADLQTIDRLWVYYSDTQYGFSSQADLWQQIGGQDYPDSLWFEALVGWSRPDAIANPTPATTPQGYFPFRPAYDTGIRNAYGGWWIREMPLRLAQCNAQ